MGAFSHVAASLDGEVLGEVRSAMGRTESWRLNAMPSGGFRVRPDHPLAYVLLEDDLIVKLYEQTGPNEKALREVFDVVGAEEVTESQVSDGIAVTMRGTFGRLGTGGGDSPGRLIGKSTTGYVRPAEDRGLTMKNIIDTVNAEADTGIRVGTIVASSTDVYGPIHWKAAGEAIVELATPRDGPDFQVLPLEPLDNAGKVGEFSAAPVLGTLRDELYFEYGTGKRNVRSFRRPVDRLGLLNRAYAVAPGYPEQESAALGVAQANHAGSQAARMLREAVISTDIPDLSLRQFLCDEHVRIRNLPRQIITWDLATPDPGRPGRVPEPFHDFDVGDVVRGRAKVGGSTRYDAFFRVFSITLNHSEEGVAQASVSVLPEAQG